LSTSRPDPDTRAHGLARPHFPRSHNDYRRQHRDSATRRRSDAIRRQCGGPDRHSKLLPLDAVGARHRLHGDDRQPAIRLDLVREPHGGEEPLGPHRRGLAAGLTAAGFGAGAALTVIPIANMIQTSGYQQTFFVFGIGQGVLIFIIAMFMVKPRLPKGVVAASRLVMTKVDYTTPQ